MSPHLTNMSNEHDFRKIGELFARVQDFLTKPELAIYSQHTVNPPYTWNIVSCQHPRKANFTMLQTLLPTEGFITLGRIHYPFTLQ